MRVPRRLLLRVRLLGVVFLLLSQPIAAATIHVATHGAFPDDLDDDREAIQDAINFAMAGDTVLFGAGTYLLDTRPPDTGSEHTLLWLKSNVTIEGAGPTTILQVGHTESFIACVDNGDPTLDVKEGFTVFRGRHGQSADGIHLHDFAIDGNADLNQIPDDCPVDFLKNDRLQGRFVMIEDGTDITIEKMTFMNSNSRQIIHLGDATSPGTLTDFQILDNQFLNHVKDTTQNDHSTIYTVGDVSGAGLVNEIRRNTLNSGGSHATKVAAAIEVHGSHTEVTANVVRGYRIGANVAATVVSTFENRFLDNQFLEVSGGFNLWVSPGFTMEMVDLENNRVEQTFVNKNVSFIDWKNVFDEIRDLTIKDNKLISRVVDLDPNLRKGRGIYIKGYAKNILIEGNIFSRTECEAIRIAGPATPSQALGWVVDPEADAMSQKSWVDGVYIHGSRIFNPGGWGDAGSGCAVGVHVLSPNNTNYQIRDVQMTPTETTLNRIRYVREDPINADANNVEAYAGIRLRGPIRDSNFKDVEILDDIGLDYVTPSSVTFVDTEIHHQSVIDDRAPSDPNLQIRACGDSTWKTMSGDSYKKPVFMEDCDSYTDWIQQ